MNCDTCKCTPLKAARFRHIRTCPQRTQRVRAPKQWEIVLRWVELGVTKERYIRDRRGLAPSYRAFDIVSRDQSHTVAPNRKHALEVARAYSEYASTWPAFAVQGTVITRVAS
jgi:hypothetical protein